MPTETTAPAGSGETKADGLLFWIKQFEETGGEGLARSNAAHNIVDICLRERSTILAVLTRSASPCGDGAVASGLSLALDLLAEHCSDWSPENGWTWRPDAVLAVTAINTVLATPRPLQPETPSPAGGDLAALSAAGLTEDAIIKLIAKTWLITKDTDEQTADELSDPEDLAHISLADYSACSIIARVLLRHFAVALAANLRETPASSPAAAGGVDHGTPFSRWRDHRAEFGLPISDLDLAKSAFGGGFVAGMDAATKLATTTTPPAAEQGEAVEAPAGRDVLAERRRVEFLIGAMESIRTARTKSSATGFPMGVYPDPAAWMEQRAEWAIRASLDLAPHQPTAALGGDAVPGGM